MTTNTDNVKQFKNLVLEGGGVKGLALTTAFKAMINLDKMKYIEKVIGTSVGSLFGILVACKCTTKEIDDYTVRFWKELTDLPEGMIQQGYNMCQHMGIHDNKNIYKVVEQLLEEKFQIKKMTLKQFYDLTQIEYTAVTANLTTRQACFMNYKTEPDLEVSKAVQMSTSVPVFFVQTKWHEMIYVDGGMCENFAIEYYDFDNGRFNDETLGLHYKEPNIENARYDVDNVLELLEGIEDAEIRNNEQQSIQIYEKRNIIEIDIGNVDALDFDISEKQKEMLMMNGYNAVIKYFAKLDAKNTPTNPDKKINGRTWSEWLVSWISK